MAIKKSGEADKFSGSTHGTGAGATAVSLTVTGTFAASGKKANGTIAFTCSNGSIGAFTYSAKKSKK